jgi:hypothetical protein
MTRVGVPAARKSRGDGLGFLASCNVGDPLTEHPPISATSEPVSSAP